MTVFRTQAAGEVEVIGMVKSGAAERSGTLQVGDLLLSIDGKSSQLWFHQLLILDPRTCQW